MKNRISLDDPDYNQNQQVVIQDNKAYVDIRINTALKLFMLLNV